MELEECQNDATNTAKAYKAVERCLNRNLKKTAPYDNRIIQTAMYSYMSNTSQEMFDYDDMLEKIFTGYAANDISDDKKRELSEKLRRLPEEKGFDRRFQSVPDAIKRKAKRTYKVTAGIELKISNLENENDIWAYEDNYGRKYLRIRVSNEQTFQTFAHSDEENREE